MTDAPSPQSRFRPFPSDPPYASPVPPTPDRPSPVDTELPDAMLHARLAADCSRIDAMVANATLGPHGARPVHVVTAVHGATAAMAPRRRALREVLFKLGFIEGIDAPLVTIPPARARTVASTGLPLGRARLDRTLIAAGAAALLATIAAVAVTAASRPRGAADLSGTARSGATTADASARSLVDAATVATSGPSAANTSVGAALAAGAGTSAASTAAATIPASRHARRSTATAFPPGSFTPPPRMERISVYRFTGAAAFLDARWERSIDGTGTAFLTGLSAGSLVAAGDADDLTAEPPRPITTSRIAPRNGEEAEAAASMPAPPSGTTGAGASAAPPAAKALPRVLHAQTFTRVVVEDARTLKLDGRRVYLAGISAPPASASCPMLDGTPDTCANRARTKLELFLRFRSVTCDMPVEYMPGRVPEVACRVGTTDLAQWMARNMPSSGAPKLTAAADGDRRRTVR